jgi:signal transduction histidine kinase
LLAAGVAHEVNRPLTGISSYAQMLMQRRHSIPDEIFLKDSPADNASVGNRQQPSQFFAYQ